jgi:hypothetical protein
MNLEDEFDNSWETVAICLLQVFNVFGEKQLRKLMHPIDVSRVPKWTMHGDTHIPASVRTICPYCNKPTTLSTGLIYQQAIGAEFIVGMAGECTQCDKTAKVWVVNARNKNQGSDKKCDSIWMLPIPNGAKIPMEKPKSIDERLFKAYLSAIACFNAGIWTSAINECGRVIEGITEDKFPTEEDRKEIKNILNDLHQDSSVKATLFRSILELTKAIRLSRMSGSHFRFTDDPGEETARRVVELTESALEYFYVLGDKSKELGDEISRLEADKKEKDQ